MNIEQKECEKLTIMLSENCSYLFISADGGGAVMTAWWEENAKEKQEKFQDRILSWNNSVMDFEEGFNH